MNLKYLLETRRQNWRKPDDDVANAVDDDDSDDRPIWAIETPGELAAQG